MLVTLSSAEQGFATNIKLASHKAETSGFENLLLGVMSDITSAQVVMGCSCIEAVDALQGRAFDFPLLLKGYNVRRSRRTRHGFFFGPKRNLVLFHEMLDHLSFHGRIDDR